MIPSGGRNKKQGEKGIKSVNNYAKRRRVREEQWLAPSDHGLGFGTDLVADAT